MVNVGDTSALIQYVNDKAPALGLDPAAVLAVAKQEGWSGLPGDNSTSFGPWQLHIGGSAPASLAGESPQQANQWAWSNAGIDYALQTMAGKAGTVGSSGYNAITAITQNFEIPSTHFWNGVAWVNLQAIEIANAWKDYAGFNTGTTPGTAGSVSTTDPALGSSAQVVSAQSTPAGTTDTPSLFGSTALGKIVGRLSSTGFWWSVGFFILAGLLIVIGLLVYFHKQVEQVVGDVGKTAVEAAAV
jgi:hypothetical protein